MADVKELISGWNTIKEAYDATRAENNPETTAKEILGHMSYEEFYCVMNAFVHIKKGDGRLSNRNRSMLCAHDKYRDFFEWDRENPFIRAGLDHIHTAHIDNLISAVLKLNESGYRLEDEIKMLDICVYCSSTDLFLEEEIDSENLTDLSFPAYIVKAYYMLDTKDDSEAGFQKWLNEYTADDTDSLYFFAKNYGFQATR